MNQRTFEKKVQEYANDKELDFHFLKKLLEPCYLALNWRDNVEVKAIKKTTFRRNTQSTLDSLLELNKFVPNDGNKKLAKRCKELLRHLDKYEDGTILMNSKMEKYFKIRFCEGLPTQRDIVNMATRYMQDIVHYHKLSEKATELSEASNNVNVDFLNAEDTSVIKESSTKVTESDSIESDYVPDLVYRIFGKSYSERRPDSHFKKIVLIKNDEEITVGEYNGGTHVPFPISGERQQMHTFEFEIK